MNRKAVLCCLTLLIAGCSDLGEAPRDEFVNYFGTIVDHGAGVFLLESDQPIALAHTVYPTNLPPEFQRDGMRVIFSGRLDILPGVRYIYLPLKLSSIRGVYIN
jgi:hypothetical protein